jgi:hypothetical protein
LRDGFGFIAHRNANAFASVIEGEDSHDAHSFATKAWLGEPISIPKINDTDFTDFY